jgi:hypothetical protein
VQRTRRRALKGGAALTRGPKGERGAGARSQGRPALVLAGCDPMRFGCLRWVMTAGSHLSARQGGGGDAAVVGRGVGCEAGPHANVNELGQGADLGRSKG